MDIEDTIRSRIEAILTKDAKNHAEMEKMATDEEPLEKDPFDEERNLYQRILNSYRNAVSEVNSLLEENISFLSAFYRIVDTIKEKDDLQEVCSQIVDSVLKDLGAEYCSIIFLEDPNCEEETFRLEGVSEGHKFLRIHSQNTLLGSMEFERAVATLVTESLECLNIQDVYKEPRFNTIDFPGVVRSLVCLPIILNRAPVGALIISHSLPCFFNDNHTRVLKILACILAHLRLLTRGPANAVTAVLAPPLEPGIAGEKPVLSIAILGFDRVDSFGRKLCLDGDTLARIRDHLEALLGHKESVLFYQDGELLVLLPEVLSEELPARVRVLREGFQRWRMEQSEKLRATRMNVGFSTCQRDEDFSRTLEIATAVMHPETDVLEAAASEV